MIDSETRRKQGVVKAVLQRFNKKRTRQSVQIVIAACKDNGLLNCRGICGYNDSLPVQPQTDASIKNEQTGEAVAQTSSLPPELQNLEELPPINELYIGERMHLAVKTSFAGYLHMFNFGTSGDPVKLFPLRANHAQYVAAQNWEYISETFTKNKMIYEERGPLNEYPERLLAVITRENINIKPGDLYRSWDIYNTVNPALSTRSVNSDEDDEWRWDRSGEWFWDLPEEKWQWGVIEVPVKQ